MQLNEKTKSLSLRAPLDMRSRQSFTSCRISKRVPRCARNDGLALKKQQQGVSIVAAIFLITALALLATAAVQLVSTGQQSISQEITSVKAYFAAQTGVQWGMYQAVYATPVTNQTITFSNAGLGNTTGKVEFAPSTFDSHTYYQITATGEYSTNLVPEFSSRKIRIRFKP